MGDGSRLLSTNLSCSCCHEMRQVHFMTYRCPADAIRFSTFMLSCGKIFDIGIVRWILMHQVEEVGGCDEQRRREEWEYESKYANKQGGLFSRFTR
ncbi:hypothetical protein ACHAW5_000250 [Stephanodiscus triporus]|uniref:Uncharacterized protein n=1 Tax=Stephanodiscus triporus TaxID=2934178 RepID=A0ABD3ND55_9STRA